MGERAPAHAVDLWCWRHPRAEDSAGRCIGRTDLALDRRRAKRLAHRIRSAARWHGLPSAASVSPLRRCRDVGHWLRRWGWRVEVDARLQELDFGAWDGLPWSHVAWAEVEAWQADLLHHAPGGGESLHSLARRVQDFIDSAAPGPRLVVTHAGWINALRSVVTVLPPVVGRAGAADASGAAHSIDAAQWPAPLPCGALWRQAVVGSAPVCGGSERDA
jgi:alpha-ribazole phosphatase